MGVESYKHQFAKATIAQWLREISLHDDHVGIPPLSWRVNRGGPNYGIWLEYPVALDSENKLVGLDPVWDESNWDGSESYSDPFQEDPPQYIFRKTDSLLDVRPPTYQEVIDRGWSPILIFDVAVQHKGSIVYALEVVHKNGISPTKLDFLRRAQASSDYLYVYTVDADWILSRVRRPDEIVCQRIL